MPRNGGFPISINFDIIYIFQYVNPMSNLGHAAFVLLRRTLPLILSGTMPDDLTIPQDGRLSENITHFARALRRAGMPVGPERVLNAIRAVRSAGFSEKEDFFHVLEACFVSKPEHLALFRQTFKLFWRDPQFLEHMMKMLSPMLRDTSPPPKPPDAERRAAEALLDEPEDKPLPQDSDDVQEFELDAELTWSADEKLRQTDFAQMTLAELNAAKRAIARIELPIKPIASRRTHPSSRGKMPDWRGTMRSSMRHGDIFKLQTRSKTHRWPNLVALCDISGSMSDYSRMLLHFLHAASNAKGAGWAAVHSFTFGTRLTNITRHLRQRDVDAALRAAGAEAQDWEGGTRIGTSLRAFNKTWSRRVLGQGAVVLLITDGLDRDGAEGLAEEAARLRLSCRKLIWLNPLLRWDGFAPRAQGVRALLPNVDSFRAAHNIASLQDLATALSRPDDVGEQARLRRQL